MAINASAILDPEIKEPSRSEVRKVEDALADAEQLEMEVDDSGLGGGAGGGFRGGGGGDLDLGGRGGASSPLQEGLGTAGGLSLFRGAGSSAGSSTLGGAISLSTAVPVALAGGGLLALNEIGKHMEEASPALQQTTSLLEDAKDNFFRPFGNLASDALRGPARGIFGATRDFAQTAEEEGIGSALTGTRVGGVLSGSFLSGMLLPGSQLIGGLVGGSSGQGLEGVFKTLRQKGSDLKTGFSDLLDETNDLIPGFDDLESATRDFWDWLTGLDLPGVGDAFSFLETKANNAGDFLGDMVDTDADSFLGDLGDTAGGVTNNLSTLGDETDSLRNAMDLLVNRLVEVGTGSPTGGGGGGGGGSGSGSSGGGSTGPGTCPDGFYWSDIEGDCVPFRDDDPDTAVPPDFEPGVDPGGGSTGGSGPFAPGGGGGSGLPDDITQRRRGGIISSPEVAQIGEAGPEVIAPFAEFRRMFENATKRKQGTQDREVKQLLKDILEEQQSQTREIQRAVRDDDSDTVIQVGEMEFGRLVKRVLNDQHKTLVTK